MSTTMKTLIGGMIIGSVVSLGSYKLLFSSASNADDNASNTVEKPLYWVAPMDANYRRDKPGKSPMGMDLIPVYENASEGNNEEVGSIRVSPDVVNNLGVRTQTASYRYLHNEINTVGYVTYDEDKLVHIHPRVQGWVEKLYVKSIGDPVKKGQALYDIYSPELVNAQEELLLALDRNNSRLIVAAENRLRALQLPPATITKLKDSKKIQQNITFYAPQNGVVENLNIREGFFVQPGLTLMSIGDLSEVWVEAEVFERQAGQVTAGTPVTMTLDYLPGKTWQGQVDYIYPTLDVNTRTMKVRLRFANELGEFKPNMFAQITIHTSKTEKSLLIPKEALIRTGNQDRVVLALGDGRFKSIAVTVGHFDSENVEILKGLIEGDMVVSSAQFLLDSESSKTSDFKRMHYQKEPSMEDNSSELSSPMSTQISSATVTGTINSLMVEHGMINISRAAIEKWGRPAATVDFITAKEVDLSEFTQGMLVQFTFEIRDGNFVITEIAPVENQPQDEAALTIEAPVVDHSKH